MAELVGGEVMYSDAFTKRQSIAEVAMQQLEASIGSSPEENVGVVLSATALAQAVQLDRITELLELLVRLSAS